MIEPSDSCPRTIPQMGNDVAPCGQEGGTFTPVGRGGSSDEFFRLDCPRNDPCGLVARGTESAEEGKVSCRRLENCGLWAFAGCKKRLFSRFRNRHDSGVANAAFDRNRVEPFDGIGDFKKQP